MLWFCLTILLAAFAVSAIKVINEIKELKLDNHIKSRQIEEVRYRLKMSECLGNAEIERLMGMWNSEMETNSRLNNIIRKMETDAIRRGNSIPSDTIQAVKYAVKHAHPDNGGNEEDFIRFRKCYEKLVGCRR